ncbi:hypothetical protein HDU92_005084 [Lobulomyces angularis]|nr:hypothetical protein HDU92_005084 [Lobulomyces angularis]
MKKKIFEQAEKVYSNFKFEDPKEFLEEPCFPHYITASKSGFFKKVEFDHRWHLEPKTHWSAPFLVGIYWCIFLVNKNEKILNLAVTAMQSLDFIKDDANIDDIGQVFILGTKNAIQYEFSKPKHDQHVIDNYQKTMLTAAETLCTRFDEKIGCIRSIVNQEDIEFGFSTTIESMMNLELLLYIAQKYPWKKRFYDIALSHAIVTATNHVRSDGSTYHYVTYDEKTGDVIKKGSFQGKSRESTWSRGQAWAIYGFLTCYKYTRDEQFLDVTLRLTSYFVKHLNEKSFIPNWDFIVKGDSISVKDTSAAAIFSSALIDLMEILYKLNLKLEEVKKFEKILKTILQKLYNYHLNKDTNANSVYLLNNGIDNFNKHLKNHGLIYGDYYFLEAISKLKESKSNFLLEVEE